MTASVLDAVQKGYQRTITARTGVAILYAANLLLVLPLAYALRATLLAAAGASLETGVLNAGFDFQIVSDIIRNNSGALGTLFTAAIGVILISFPLSIFLSGGIVASVRQDDLTVTAAEVLAAAAAYFWRFLRLAAIVFAAWLLVAIPLLAVVFWSTGMWQAGAQSEVPGTISLGLRLLSLALLAIPLVMAYDYARIDAVMTGGNSMRRCAWRGVRFMYRRLGRTIKLQLLLMLLFGLLAAVYVLLADILGTASPAALAPMVVVQQLYVFKRMGLRVFGFASESVLYRELNPVGGGIPGWDAGHSWG